MPSFTKLAIASACAANTLAHGTVQSFLTDGTFNQGFLTQYYYMFEQGQTPPTHFGWYAENLDNGFVEPSAYGTPDIICHKNAKPASATAKVAAGGKVEFQWTAWPNAHVGPVITYMANCNGNCAKVDKTQLKFFKIDEAGYNVDTKSWAAIDMIANNNTWSTTVPANIVAGNYVIRHEIISLQDAAGAQNYPQCVNIEVTGSGTENPEGVLGTQLYSSTDAGIAFSPYTTFTKYQIPGPALFGSGPDNTVPGTPSAPAAPSVTPTPSNMPAPPPSGEDGIGDDNDSDDSDSLPETFTLATFLVWLQKMATSNGVTRRHARAF
ncbi:lytic polysaccharide monooxygenase [Sporormia fimetaria CBS 119925]|uniref:Lytic polysaccharide monooxygenase n=1 Tax=Sporormia fimetaria CBS 119925 TaxID=1340428 RepID=A0A6A6V7X6_9PLEO|nr:lytic polysaccharide monooxygenase [Sporormia fimetaria CBS 119925]